MTFLCVQNSLVQTWLFVTTRKLPQLQNASCKKNDKKQTNSTMYAKAVFNSPLCNAIASIPKFSLHQ